MYRPKPVLKASLLLPCKVSSGTGTRISWGCGGASIMEKRGSSEFVDPDPRRGGLGKRGATKSIEKLNSNHKIRIKTKGSNNCTVKYLAKQNI